MIGERDDIEAIRLCHLEVGDADLCCIVRFRCAVPLSYDSSAPQLSRLFPASDYAAPAAFRVCHRRQCKVEAARESRRRLCRTTDRRALGSHCCIALSSRRQQNHNTVAESIEVLFGWNHAAEIMAKEAAFKAAGGQWIVYVPKVQVLT